MPEADRVTEIRFGSYNDSTTVYAVDGGVQTVVDEFRIPDAGGVTSAIDRQIYRVNDGGQIESIRSDTDFAGPEDAEEVYGDERPVIVSTADDVPVPHTIDELDDEIADLFKGLISGSPERVEDEYRLKDGRKIVYSDNGRQRKAKFLGEEDETVATYFIGDDGVIRKNIGESDREIPDEVKYDAFGRMVLEDQDFEVDGTYEFELNNGIVRLVNTDQLESVLDLDGSSRYPRNKVISLYFSENPERKEVYQDLEEQRIASSDDKVIDRLRERKLQARIEDIGPLRAFAAERLKEVKNESIIDYVFGDTEVTVSNVNRDTPGIEDDEGNIWYVDSESTQLFGGQIIDSFEADQIREAVDDSSDMECEKIRNLLENGIDEVGPAPEIEAQLS